MAGDRDTAKRADDPLVNGPWLSNEDMAALPNVTRDFDLNRDPLVGQQLHDMEKTEAQRRGTETDRGSGMVERDKPNPRPRPPQETGRPVDNAAFSSRWLVEQRDAALANAASRQRASNDTPHHGRTPREPSR